MKELFRDLKYSYKYVKDKKKYFLLLFIVLGLEVYVNVLTPIYSAKIIVNITSNKLEQAIYVSCMLLFANVIIDVLFFLQNLITSKIRMGTTIKVSLDLSKEILKINTKVLNEKGSGFFVERLNGDANKISNIFTSLSVNIGSMFRSIGICIATLFICKEAFVYLLIYTGIMFILEYFQEKKYHDNRKTINKMRDKFVGFSSEVVRGANDIKMLNAEDSFLKVFINKIDSYNKFDFRINNTDSFFRLLIDFFYDFSHLGLTFLLVYLVTNNSLSAANAVVIFNYSYGFSNFAWNINNIIRVIDDFKISSTRVFEIIRDKTFTKEKFGDVSLKKVKGDFSFKNVSFSYDKKKVLDNISFDIKRNSTTAFVGKSGAGKSTIFNLLCKMYDNYDGLITIDNKDIRTLTKDSIRGNITIISQNPYIFNLSIKDNLRLVKEDATLKDIKKACKMAMLDQFIESLPDKYDTVLGEGGVTLSGGQKQRLAIARAFIQKTEIILFDEATSALDNETQKGITDAINNLKKDYTILIIAHRLSTIINSDKIMFIEDGKIKAEGTHDELLKKCSSYKKLYNAEIRK